MSGLAKLRKLLRPKSSWQVISPLKDLCQIFQNKTLYDRTANSPHSKVQPKCRCREHHHPIISLNSPLKVPRHRSRSINYSSISNLQLISCSSLNCQLSCCRVWSLSLRMNWWGCTRKCCSKNRNLSSTWSWWETRLSRITNWDACCSRGWTTSRQDSMCSWTERASLMVVNRPITTYLVTSQVHFRKLIMLLSLTDKSTATAKATLLTQKCL